MYRMLKPGGIVYNLEWVAKDFGDRPANDPRAGSHRGAMDFHDETHRELARRTGVLRCAGQVRALDTVLVFNPFRTSVSYMIRALLVVPQGVAENL